MQLTHFDWFNTIHICCNYTRLQQCWAPFCIYAKYTLKNDSSGLFAVCPYLTSMLIETHSWYRLSIVCMAVSILMGLILKAPSSQQTFWLTVTGVISHFNYGNIARRCSALMARRCIWTKSSLTLLSFPCCDKSTFLCWKRSDANGPAWRCWWHNHQDLT